jgi:hypothetical protein
VAVPVLVLVEVDELLPTVLLVVLVVAVLVVLVVAPVVPEPD